MSTNNALADARALYQRRVLLSKTMTPEVLDAIEESIEVKGMVFAFPLANPDPLIAMRRDTLLGTMRTLRFEASPEAVNDAAKEIERLELLVGEEAAHA